MNFLILNVFINYGSGLAGVVNKHKSRLLSHNLATRCLNDSSQKNKETITLHYCNVIRINYKDTS